MVATSFSPVRSPWPANSGFIKGTVERKFLLPTCCLNKELSSSFLERRNRSPKRDTVRTVVAVGKHLSTRCSASRAEVRLGSENPCCAAGRRRSHRGDFRKNGCSPNRAHVPRMPLFSAARRISSKDPFGNTLASSGTLADVNTYRFSSQEYHQNSGLLLYLRRAYDPNLQRFLGRDPVAELGGLNLYGFARNGPLNRFDSWGLDDAMDELNRLIPGDHVPRARDVHALDPDTQDNLMDTVGPLIDPSWKNFCRVGAKFYNFFDPARQLREGLHLMPLLSLLAGQPELAALFSLTDAILYASEGDIKGTILAGIGALPLVGAVGKAVGAVTGTTARALTVADLGIQGTVKQLNASLSIRNGVAYVRVAALSGEIKNPLQVMNNLIGLAKSQGATALRIEAMVSNPRLRSILEARYGLFHSGGKDVITVLIP